MRYRHLFALFAPLAFAMPVVAAEWALDAKATFVRECVNGARGEHPPAQLQAYCGCAADKVSSEFSAAEMREMSRQSPPDPALQQRLVNASSSCGAHLQK